MACYRPRRCTIGVAAALLVLSGLASAQPTPDATLALANAGAAQLALRQVATQQPALSTHPQQWAQWERVRTHINTSLKDWAAIAQRAQTLSADAPASFKSWFLFKAAAAQLKLGHGRLARRCLGQRKQLPLTSPEAAKLNWYAIQSFISDGNLAKALQLVTARRQHYPGAVQPRLTPLQAWLLLRLDQPNKAFKLAHAASMPAAQPLAWLAGIRSGQLEPKTVRQAIRAFLSQDIPPKQRRRALLVEARMALLVGHGIARLQALEQAVAIDVPPAQQRKPFMVHEGALWRALGGLGNVLAYQHQLTAQNRDQGLAVAQSLDKRLARQALCVHISSSAKEPAVIKKARQCLIESIQAGGHAQAILRQLYIASGRFVTLTDIPMQARYALLKGALAADDNTFAAQLFATLSAPEDGENKVAWQLQKARVTILGGKALAGIKTLNQLFESHAAFSFNRLESTLFALQRSGHNKAALNFFRRLLKRKPPAAIRQKILFWMADSSNSLKRYAAAARLYLAAAASTPDKDSVRWARTARFRAADALKQAGLVDDARRVYQRLLDTSHSDARKSVIKQKMKDLLITTQTHA